MHTHTFTVLAGSWPTGRILPQLQVVNVTSFASMRCFSEGETVWIRNGNIISRGEELVLNIVSQTQSGKYYCHGIKNGTSFMAGSTLIIAGKRTKCKNACSAQCLISLLYSSPLVLTLFL